MKCSRNALKKRSLSKTFLNICNIRQLNGQQNCDMCILGFIVIKLIKYYEKLHRFFYQVKTFHTVSVCRSWDGVGSGSVEWKNPDPQPGMRIRIRSDPLIFGLPDPDPTCNNGYIRLFSSWTKYKPELTNSSLKSL